MERIVVGVDASEGSRRALQWAVDEARIRNARVVAVHAWHYPYVPTGPFGVGASVPITVFEEEAQAALDESVDSVDASGLAEPIERVLVCDGAVVALLEAAKDASLLVVGSRGRGGFKGLLLGSVSQEVAHHAPCPVVIVPASARRDES